MNPLGIFCLAACLLAVVSALPNNQQQQQQQQQHRQQQSQNSNSLNNNMKPTEWISPSELENLPALNDITLQQLESMSAQEGAELVDKMYHLSQINHELRPSFTPNPSDIPAYTVTPNGQRNNFNLNQLVANAKQQPNFGNEEVTVIITGMPQQSSPSVAKATRKLVQALMQRYNGQQQQQQAQQNKDYDYGNDKQNQARTSSEEDYNESWKTPKANRGNIVVIDLGATLNNFKRMASLDIDRTGAMIGKILVQLTNEVDVPQEIIHLIGQGVGAHVAGTAARQYTRLTGHQVRRVTGLDPSKIYAKNANTLTGMARGDAEFVDAIHTSAYGMGTPARVADVDFYPNGPSTAAPGADNIVEASMRATRYFAESARPGNERNFPAVAANSLQQYKNNNGHGKRTYMGIATDYDAEGDYVLQVNSKSPFGRNAPAQKQNSYHGAHQSWRNNNSNNNNNQDYA